MKEIIVAAVAAWAVDGDGLLINGQEHRLDGIDAVELRQVCAERPRRTVVVARGTDDPLTEGKRWACGIYAARFLRGIIARADRVRCRWEKRGVYGRPLSDCYARIGGRWVFLNERLVAVGWATAFRRYSLRFVAQEDAARRAGLGLWAGAFERPGSWRRRTRKLKRACRARGGRWRWGAGGRLACRGGRR